MPSYEDEKAARADLKALLDKTRAGDAPVSTTLRQMGQQFRMAESQGKRDAIKATMQLIVKHRWIFNLPQDRMKALLEEAAGLNQSTTTRANG